MDIIMEISSESLSAEQLDGITRHLAGTIEQETVITPSLPASDTEAGAKGEPITIGTLILTFISSGAAVALFEVLKAYFSREPSLEISLKKPDGSEMSFSAKNMDASHVGETLDQLKKVLEG